MSFAKRNPILFIVTAIIAALTVLTLTVVPVRAASVPFAEIQGKIDASSSNDEADKVIDEIVKTGYAPKDKILEEIDNMIGAGIADRLEGAKFIKAMIKLESSGIKKPDSPEEVMRLMKNALVDEGISPGRADTIVYVLLAPGSGTEGANARRIINYLLDLRNAALQSSPYNFYMPESVADLKPYLDQPEKYVTNNLYKIKDENGWWWVGYDLSAVSSGVRAELKKQATRGEPLYKNTTARAIENIYDGGDFVWMTSIQSPSTRELSPADEFARLCAIGTPEQIKEAIAAGVDPNTRNETAIHVPTDTGGSVSVDPGRSALHFAARSNKNAEAVSLLLAAGADVNARDTYDSTALGGAASYNTSEVVSALLKDGADVNASNKGGYTPLMLAAARNTPEVVDLLLDAGADAGAKSNKGETALDCAAENAKLKDTDAYRRLEAATTDGSRPAGSAKDDAKAPQSEKVAEAAVLKIEITGDGNKLTVEQDGRVIVKRTFSAGTTRSYDVNTDTTVTASAGNKAAVTWQGKRYPSMGADASPVTVVFKPDGSFAAVEAKPERVENVDVPLVAAAGENGAREDKPVTALSAREFIKLCVKGTPEEITAAIKSGADVNAKDKDYYGGRPLMEAAKYNPNPETIAVLIESGADVNARNRKGETALISALGNENPETLTTLIKSGADVNAKDKHGYTVLMCAAEYRNPEALTTLIKSGADVNAKDKNGWTALMSAAWLNENPEALTTLIKSGADVNAKDKDGMTALMYAVWQNKNPEVTATLIKSGADVNAKDKNGMTALMYAAWQNKNPEVTAALIEGGAEVNAADRSGKTALMRAAREPEVEAVLIKSGADANTAGKNAPSDGWDNLKSEPFNTSAAGDIGDPYIIDTPGKFMYLGERLNQGDRFYMERYIRFDLDKVPNMDVDFRRLGVVRLADLFELSTRSASDGAEASEIILHLQDLKQAEGLFHIDEGRWPGTGDAASLDIYADSPIVGANPPKYKSVQIYELVDDEGYMRRYVGVTLFPETNGALGVKLKLAGRADDVGILEMTPGDGKAPKPYTDGDTVWMELY